MPAYAGVVTSTTATPPKNLPSLHDCAANFVRRCIASISSKTTNQFTHPSINQTINSKTTKLPDRMPDVRTKRVLYAHRASCARWLSLPLHAVPFWLNSGLSPETGQILTRCACRPCLRQYTKNRVPSLAWLGWNTNARVLAGVVGTVVAWCWFWPCIAPSPTEYQYNANTPQNPPHKTV